ncbi:TIGR01841 family phasin [Porphyrobacter algicida]|uniref:TIGR01841 family phasin n=1 Tax=Qipengyuania algicida TaxID=1836209 RepID=A0A845AKB4_9SPHN|nr:phasin family protein [Qipengyuania algicida]MXP29593.1 TIGR01841 family phasin [Qipengyuania algicida]
MADTHSKIDAAAEKAFAEAAEKKTAQAAKAPQPVPAEQPEAAANTKPAPVDKIVASPKKASAPKPAAKKAVARKPKTKKAAAAKPAAKRAPAKPLTDTPISQLKEKIMATAKTTDFSKTFKDAAAEVQTRVKAAYEKGTEMTGEFTEFHKGNVDAFVESGKVLASGMQDMGRTAMEELKTAAETATADVKKMAAVKSPTELFQLQGEIARRNFDAAMAQGSKNAELFMKLANDVFAPLSSRASVAAEKLTKAA